MADLWKIHEKNILKLSHATWGAPATPATINGVNHDCVIKYRPDYWIIIETTRKNDLDKLRGDVARLSVSRTYLMSNNIYAECYFICETLSPVSSLRTTGEGVNVQVMSIEEFSTKLFDYELYKNTRSKRNFGSDRNQDSIKYIEVKYEHEKNKKVSIDNFVTSLTTGRNVVLLGDFGTGKSRCIRELFSRLNKLSSQSYICHTFAINLRDVWGARSYEDIISMHLRSIGVSTLVDITLRLTEDSPIILLLDGFDEIGTQSWGDESSEIKAAKMASLAGVRDIIRKRKKGIFIVGREHYFDNDDEMFECLGLKRKTTSVCRCKDEFSDNEIVEYLAQAGIDLAYPKWLPKKPLLCEHIKELGAKRLAELMTNTDGEPEFWRLFFDKIAERDCDISTSLSSGAIKKVLVELARMSRQKKDQMDSFSVAEIRLAFRKSVGRNATSESEIMLQRLPGLGRFDSQSDERKFVDRYLINGLVAEDLANIVSNADTGCFEEKWINDSSAISAYYAANFIKDKYQNAYSVLTQCSNSINETIKGDLLHILFYTEKIYDFKNFQIDNTSFSCVDLSHKKIKNLTISGCLFDELNIMKTSSSKFYIIDCEIDKIVGISSVKSTPKWIKNCTIRSCIELKTKKNIRNQESLSLYQRHFLEIIQKIFFQRGVSRSQNAMFKHKDSNDYKAINSILTLLNSEGIISINKRVGNDGNLYKPNRNYTSRMQAIKDELHHSTDEIWLKISKM